MQMYARISQATDTERRRNHSHHRGTRSSKLCTAHVHTRMCAHARAHTPRTRPIALGVSVFQFPCAHLGTVFLTSLGPLEPVLLPSELGWVLLLTEIRERGRAIFCHRQEVRTKSKAGRRLTHDLSCTLFPKLCPAEPQSPARSQ